jgi:hypothetical protein
MNPQHGSSQIKVVVHFRQVLINIAHIMPYFPSFSVIVFQYRESLRGKWGGGVIVDANYLISFHSQTMSRFSFGFIFHIFYGISYS